MQSIPQKVVPEKQPITQTQTIKHPEPTPAPPAPRAPVEGKTCCQKCPQKSVIILNCHICFVDAAQKALNLQRLREEALRRLKKRASTFESEVQAFKQLTNEIKVNNVVLYDISIRRTKKFIFRFRLGLVRVIKS